MDRFKNKYRISSARLRSWDYGSNGMYFITVCTKNRKNYFGEIIDGEMYLNDIGRMAEQCWTEIPNHFQFVELGEFVIMPNHIHGIIIINKPGSVNNAVVVAAVETGHALSLQQQPHFRFRNQGNNTVSAIVGSFKSAVTKLVHKMGDNTTGSTVAEFAWQSRFHDHIIRTHEDYVRISNYILNNPSNWNQDKFYN